MTPRKLEPNSLAYRATDAIGRRPTGPGERAGYWDAWKGLAILAVVALHATDQSLTFRVGSLNWWFGLTLCQLLDFAVPLFLAIAGYFAGRSTASTATEFYGRRIVRILPPYLFWTVITLLLVRRPDLQSPRALLDDLVLGRGIGIGYFVIVLLQYVLITPLLRKLTSTRSQWLAMVAIGVASLAWNYAVRTRWPAGRLGEFPFYALPFFVWYPFYHLGLYAATANLRFPRTVERHPRILLVAFAAFVTAAMLEGDLLARDGFLSLATSQIKTTSFLASISLFLFSLSNRTARQVALTARRRMLEYLGRRSYSIYLMHLLFLRPIGAILSKFGTIYRLQPIFVVASVGLTLTACVVLNYCAEWTIPSRFRIRYMGMG